MPEAEFLQTLCDRDRIIQLNSCKKETSDTFAYGEMKISKKVITSKSGVVKGLIKTALLKYSVRL